MAGPDSLQHTVKIVGKKLKETTEYIDNSADFAKPVLKRLRRLFHKASPKIDEVIKWGVPHYEYNGLVGGMASFKKHATCLLYTSPSPRDLSTSRMPSSA